MIDRPSLTEFDILAYVDGQLDHAPQRKAEVEALLASAPRERARAEAYQQQNKALRQAYGHRIADPLPERLVRSLESRPKRRLQGRLAVAAVSIAASLFAGYVGWTAARWDDDPGWSAHTLLEESYRDLVSRQASETETPASVRSGEGGERLAMASNGQALGRLTDQISLTVQAPDLGEFGYEIVARESIARGGNETVRLTYAGPSGKPVHLYLSPRWDERESEPHVTSRGDISMGYWVNGPLAVALAGRLSPEETRTLADRFRDAMIRSGRVTPKIELPTGLGQEVTLNDDARPVPPDIATEDTIRPDGQN